MRTLICAALGLLVSACAHVVAVNPDGGIVENAGTARGALRLADAHCAKTGRTAQAQSYDALMGSLTFACVPK